VRNGSNGAAVRSTGNSTSLSRKERELGKEFSLDEGGVANQGQS
jgi:hypothetical protein